MKVEIRTLALTRKVALRLPHRQLDPDFDYLLENAIGFVRPESLDIPDYGGNLYALVQLSEKAFWLQVGYYVPRDYHLEEITLY